MNDFDIGSIPNKPGIYVIYDKNGVAYIGQSTNLRTRIKQHLINRDTTATVASAPVMLNPDKVRHVHYWWSHEAFSNINKREAAESVAFKVLKPSLRSRGTVSDEAKNILKDPKYQEFRDEMHRLFRGKPDGTYQHPTVDNLTDMVSKLYQRVAEIEEQLKKKGN